MKVPRWLWLLVAVWTAACDAPTSPVVDDASTVGSIQLSQTELTLGVGGTAALQVLVRDGGGRSLSDQMVFWSSSDSAVARVSASGLVTAITPGSAQIAATAAGRSAVAIVNVAPQAVASIVITPMQPRVLVGAQVELTARTLDAQGQPLTGRLVNWSSSDPAIASVNTAGVVTGVAAGVATIVANSEGRSASVGVTVSLVPVASVSVSPAEDTVTVSQSTQLIFTARDTAGGILTERHVTWSTSSSSVATVSSAGLVMGVAPGIADITAASEGKTASARIHVLPRPVGAVIVSPSQVALVVGESGQLTVQVTDASGALLSGRPVSFQSANSAIATVSITGLVNGVAAGSTDILVSSEGKTTTAKVTVSPVPVAMVEVTPATTDLTVGETRRLTAIARDASGNVLANRPVAWSSGSPNIATVANDGTVQAVGVGTAIIIAGSEGRVGTSTVNVRSVPVGSVVVTPDRDSLIVGDMLSLTYVVRDLNGAIVNGRTATWISSNNTVAAVASDGRVVGVSPGVATISAVVDGVSGQGVITVIREPVLNVTAQPTSLTLFIGDTARIVGTPRGRNNAPLTGRIVSFVSDDASVASVSQSGLVTAHKPGSTNIRVSSEGKQATVPVTVARVPVASVSVTLEPSSLAIGATSQATAILRDASGNALTGREINWSSSNTNVAVVNSTGVITAKAAGTANIVATSEGKAGSASLTVTVVPVASVTISLSPNTLEVGDAGTTAVTLRDASGNVLTGRQVTWNSSSPGVASVNQSGAVTALAVGTTTISATSEGKTGSATLSVTRARVAEMVITLAPASVMELDTTRARAELRDKHGNVLTGIPITWSSSNSDIASIAASGLVTAHRAGVATISAAADGKTALRTVTVQEAQVARVVVTPPSATIRYQGSASQRRTQLTAVAYDNKDRALQRTFTWSSNRFWVAIVDQNGLVTGLSRGEARISATAGGRTGSADITVVRNFNDDD